jgi:Zn-dependent M28 family amino/carboxypeptidase
MTTEPAFLPDLLRLERDVRRLAVVRHPDTAPAALKAAEDFVALELGAAGLRVERQLFASNGGEFHNVIGTLDGSDPGRPLVVVGAHFDSAPHTPGADDNASAVAAMLEVARLLRGRRPAATIEFVGYNLEEIQRGLGSRLGSRHHARQLRASGRRVAGALVLEMVGFTGPQRYVPYTVRLVKRIPKEGTFVAAVGDGRSRALLAAFRRAAEGVVPLVHLAVPFKGWALPYSRMSDNARYWDEGIPSLMITDTAFLRNPHYHRASDTPETLDYGFMGKVVTAVARTVAELAG